MPTRTKNQKPHVMLVLSSISGGGAELVSANLCRNLDRDLFNVTICHLKERGERGDALLKEGYDVVGIQRCKSGPAKYMSCLSLRKLIREKKIDLLHSHDRDSLYDCASARMITPGVKLVHTYHFGNYPHIPKLHLKLESFFSKKTDQLVAVGHRQKEQIIDTFNLNAEKIKTIYNGITPLQILDSQIMRREGNGPIIIGAISTFIKQKGLDYLFDIAEAIKKHNLPVIFWIAGAGPLYEELEIKKSKMGMDDTIKFLGWVPNAAQTILPQIDIFIQTSLWEAMSMAILEAMSAGKPIVATDVGENRAIIDGAGAGFVFEPRDVENSVKYLERLIKDSKLREDMGRNGRDAVQKLYTVSTMTQNYQQLYQKILQIN